MGQVESLIGRVLVRIEGAKKHSEAILFICDDGTRFLMDHYQGCCESVTVEDVCGDVADLLGSPIVKATKDTNSEENPVGVTAPRYQDSFTWTFYNIATANGHVTIRWYGGSNGYYSESVDFEQVKNKDTQ